MEKKPLINKDKWTKNDIHLFVILILIGIYPVFASSFFGIFYFVLYPVLALTTVSAFHYYWLVASLLWVLLCAMILPCLRGIDRDESTKPAGIEAQEGTVYSTAQPFIKVEDVDKSKRDSILTTKSNRSKEFEEEKAEKESLEKFRDDLENSTSSLEKGEITQSGEFLNECIDSLGPDKPQEEEEAVCEVHVDQSSRPQLMEELQDKLKSKYKDTDIDKEDIKQDLSSESRGEILQESKEEKDRLREKNDSDTDESISKLPVDEEEQQTRSAPLELHEGDAQESEEVLAEVEELRDEVPLRRKPNTTIDTSRTSGYYECSMPTPKSASSDRPESNMVFLFVNPEIAAKEQDIIVNQQGEVVQQKED